MDKAAYVLVGVVIGVILNTVKEWWFQRRKSRKDLEYLTIRIACFLDTFVNACADVVADDGLSYGQPGTDGCRSIQVEAPNFDPLTFDVEWKSLSAKLMYEVLNFPNLIKTSNHLIAGAFEFAASPPDYEEGFEERQFQYANIGLKAHDLSKKLRKVGGLPSLEKPTPEEWSPVQFMVEKIAKIHDLKEQRAARHKNYN
ncbi:hypothetical protein [Candidatus Nitrotoga sp. M5]|uniref:hypothetical protein n=1 Tax=Candidatus Nitrotoga sp. M5 TaxID=2890409 RepID=UPI001EF5D11B|nr:hypothetical protein [Candidatus Nitrotoga sp. M5]CAH1387843.1 conserved hypothetical protein [Candidatus Nitrotoga sp. M5]